MAAMALSSAEPEMAGEQSCKVAVCVKWVPTHPSIDPLSGKPDFDPRFTGWSPADEAALEIGLGLGQVTIATVGPGPADALLRRGLAAGAVAAIRIDDGGRTLTSEAVAAELASHLGHADFVICGDHSLDRGSGSTPAFLADGLNMAQALGLVRVTPTEQGLSVERRLDRGRREIIDLTSKVVLSVEGGARLRRAGVQQLLAAEQADLEVRPAAATAPGPNLSAVSREPIRLEPYRPPTRVVPPPEGPTNERLTHLLGSETDHQPAQVVEAEPERAAEIIIEQLRQWNQLEQ